MMKSQMTFARLAVMREKNKRDKGKFRYSTGALMPKCYWMQQSWGYTIWKKPCEQHLRIALLSTYALIVKMQKATTHREWNATQNAREHTSTGRVPDTYIHMSPRAMSYQIRLIWSMLCVKRMKRNSIGMHVNMRGCRMRTHACSSKLSRLWA